MESARRYGPEIIAVIMKLPLLIRRTLPLVLLAALVLTVTASAQEPAAKEQAAGDKDTVVVVAEGVGLTAEAAEKQAFRSAVRQVVGALVDSTTIVKNDKLIEDEVLTYSHGFIKSWDPVSTRRVDALFIVTIKAVVKRRDLVERLTKFKITSTRVDGKNLFGAAVTRMEARENATLILSKVFEEWPRLLKAVVDDNPTYDEVKQELRLQVKLGIAEEDYGPFQERLLGVVSEIAIAKESVLTPAVTKNARSDDPRVSVVKLAAGKLDKDTHARLLRECPNSFSVFQSKLLAKASIQSMKTQTWCLWVLTGNPSTTSARWQGFLLDADINSILPYLQHGSHSLEIAVCDSEGIVLAETPFKIAPVKILKRNEPAENLSLGAALLGCNGNNFPFDQTFPLNFPRADPKALRKYWSKSKETTGMQLNVFVSRYTFGVSGYSNEHFSIFRYLHVEQKLPISVDLLKQVDSIEARVKFALPRTDSP